MCRFILAGILLLSLTACLELDYYLHAVSGHLQLISKRQSISSLLEKPSTSAALHAKLQQISEIRDFASQSLLLPDNESYRSFVQLDRPYVVWNVVATPEFSLEPLQWCFPVVGCVNYRGYFDQDSAQTFARGLAREEYDTILVGVPAYSTLSWFDDPILSSFSHWPETSLAKLIFHELAHQKLYIPDDSVFNESFATAVEQTGIKLWLEQRNDSDLQGSYRRQEQRQKQFLNLLRTTRKQLEVLYKKQISEQQMRNDKAAIFSDLQKRHRGLKHEWQGYSGYDTWFKQLNNARFASLETYHRWVPAFLLAFQQEGQDLVKFYRRCQAIAALPEQQRHQLLDRLTESYRIISERIGAHVNPTDNSL